ncbi:MAG: hypothetical protein ACR2JC_13295 [Chloroflexota bacterium]|nr:MAG: hypothetical protein DLM70_14995 [Chloroflexota bacterium]
MESPDRGLVTRFGSVEIDWARAAGYYGGIGLAVAYGMIEAPLAVFIAAVPFFKMLNRPTSTLPARALSQVMDGASKPVGGDGEASIRITPKPSPGSHRVSLGPVGRELSSMWSEARALSDSSQR